jgi:hypothetical protein
MNYSIQHTDYGEIHLFQEGNCTVTLRKISDEVFSLDDFRCNNTHFKGEGRKMLLYALLKIKEQNKYVEQIILSVVPNIILDKHDNLEKTKIKKELAKKSLKKYYTELGFNVDTNGDEDDMEGNIDEIISNITSKSGGRRKKKKKTYKKKKPYNKRKTYKNRYNK